MLSLIGMSMSYEDELRRSFKAVLREGASLYGGEGRLQQTYERLTTRLASLGLDYSLVGGYALILHGVRRFTEDLDLLVTADALAAIRESLLGSGYTTIPGNERNIRDAKTGVCIEFLCAGEFPGDGKEKPIAFPDPASVTEEVDGVRVVTLETLIELKLASGMTAKGRLQDLADVQRLIQAHNLTATYVDEIHPYVRQAFLDLLA